MDLDGSIFWYFGGALVLAALAISYVGIKGKENFPPTGRAMWATTTVFALVVVATAAYAVANASEEKQHRDEELAEEEAQAEEAVAQEEPAAPTETAPDQPSGGQPPGSGAPAQSAEELALTSPEDGSLMFDPDGLDAAAGTITLAYDNPSPVIHNIAIEDNGGKVLAESEDVTGGTVSIEADLVPGEYAYFCTIPGHREGGMEGVLTVE
ncbi:hypothetical protein BH20ACT15_BH20ACT15_08550 [soil metagenome]